MLNAIRAGTAYFAAVFAIGFGLGILRTLLVAPLVGSLAATAIELPLLLGMAWPICDILVRRLAVPPAIAARLAMGGIAFALLMVAELAISVLLAGRSPAAHWALYRGLPEQLGLAGQLLFAGFPLIQRKGSRGR